MPVRHVVQSCFYKVIFIIVCFTECCTCFYLFSAWPLECTVHRSLPRLPSMSAGGPKCLQGLGQKDVITSPMCLLPFTNPPIDFKLILESYSTLLRSLICLAHAYIFGWSPTGYSPVTLITRGVGFLLWDPNPQTMKLQLLNSKSLLLNLFLLVQAFGNVQYAFIDLFFIFLLFLICIVWFYSLSRTLWRTVLYEYIFYNYKQTRSCL